MPAGKHPRSRKKEQPHDAVFKAFFSDAKIARNYLLHYTPSSVHEQIDFLFFQKSNTAFVNGRFGISFSDIVYETRLTGSGEPARLLFLFEHKSYIPSQSIHLQLLDYLLQIWEDDLKNRRPLSSVIPIVVYHGEKAWEQKQFSDYFKGMPEDWQAFVPNFHYLLTDLSQIPPKTIKSHEEQEYLKNLFLALKFARNEVQLKENWREILTFGVLHFEDDREGILLQTLTLYIINLFDMTQGEFKTLNKQLPESEQDWIDKIPEIFGEKWKKKGLREGRVEGRAEGRAELTREYAVKTIQKFPVWSDGEIAEFLGVSLLYVQDLKKELALSK